MACVANFSVYDKCNWSLADRLGYIQELGRSQPLAGLGTPTGPVLSPKTVIRPRVGFGVCLQRNAAIPGELWGLVLRWPNPRWDGRPGI